MNSSINTDLPIHNDLEPIQINQTTEQNVKNVINQILQNQNTKNELCQILNNQILHNEKINNEKLNNSTTVNILPIKTHNFNNDLWHISFSSLSLIILIIILLYMKWNDNDY